MPSASCRARCSSRVGHQSERGAPGLDECLARSRSCGFEPVRLDLGLASLQVHEDRAERSGDGVVDVAYDAFALLGDGQATRPVCGVGVHACVGDRDRGVLGEQAQDRDVGLGELLVRLRAEHDAGSDDRALPLDRHGGRGVQPGPVGRDHVAAGHLGVAVEHRRPAPGHDCSGRSFGEREDAPLLALDADVDLFVIGPGLLVDRRDRAGVTAEQRDRPPQDPVEQRLERELTGQVLDRPRQRVELISWTYPVRHRRSVPPRRPRAVEYWRWSACESSEAR